VSLVAFSSVGGWQYGRALVEEGEARGEFDESELKLVAGLRAGDEQAFVTLFDNHYASMLSVARSYVPTREAAEDAVQETFAAIIEGIDRFEGRSSLKTWMFRILLNRSITRGEREARTQPFSSLASTDREPVVDPARFFSGHHRLAGMWAAPPSQNFPEESALGSELRELLRSVIEELPPQQAIVLSLRDAEDMSSADVCDLLGITEGNQRVLLHRARAKCRTVLERHGDVLSGAVR
jgi:RNA polymerase sigma-70 factor (ECF subfamily)